MDLRQYVIESRRIVCGPGLEVHGMAGATCISLVKHPLDTVHSGIDGGQSQNGWLRAFFARITSHTEMITGRQWRYTFAEVHKDDIEGYDGNWLTRSGGASGNCYNTIEDRIETASDGVSGEGIDLEALQDEFPTFSVVPCPVGAIVEMKAISNSAHEIEYWFQFPRSVDGSCA